MYIQAFCMEMDTSNLMYNRSISYVLYLRIRRFYFVRQRSLNVPFNANEIKTFLVYFLSNIVVNFQGPRAWGEKYPVAFLGRKQSPIDIDTRTTRIDLNLPDLRINYDATKCVTLTNSGRSFAVSARESGTSKIIKVSVCNSLSQFNFRNFN